MSLSLILFRHVVAPPLIRSHSIFSSVYTYYSLKEYMLEVLHHVIVQYSLFTYIMLHFNAVFHIIQIYYGIKCGKVLNGSFLSGILKVNLFAFAYRLFHDDFSPLDGLQANANKLISRISL